MTSKSRVVECTAASAATLVLLRVYAVSREQIIVSDSVEDAPNLSRVQGVVRCIAASPSSGARKVETARGPN